jgi:hypothetical protein
MLAGSPRIPGVPGVIRWLDLHGASRRHTSVAVGVRGAMGAAIDIPTHFHAMPDHATLAMGAARSHAFYRAFEAIKGLDGFALSDRERSVIVIPANIALCHETSPSDIYRICPLTC